MQRIRRQAIFLADHRQIVPAGQGGCLVQQKARVQSVLEVGHTNARIGPLGEIQVLA
jgi:hypothetical protein